MAESPDANLQLKKRARRRLVGALALAGLAAIVLPMVMDDEPKQQVQDIQLSIPGQDQAPFVNRLESGETAATAAPVKDAEQEEAMPAEKEVPPVAGKPAPKAVEKPAAKADGKEDRQPEKPAEKSSSKVAEKPTLKTSDKAVEKTPEKAADKASAKPDKDDKKAASAKPASDEQRAAAIMNGKNGETTGSGNKGNGPCVILIGAFANPANVKVLQSKIGELGMKVFTEPLDSPQGKKTRVRAGPFPTREAAEKALDKLKRIGVNGVIAAKP